MFKFLGEILRPYKKWFAATLILQITANLLSLYLPSINEKIMDIGIPNQDVKYILIWGGVMIILSLLQVVINVLANVAGAITSLSSGKKLRERIYRKILSMSQREISLFGAPTLVTRATNDVQQILNCVSAIFMVVLSAPIMFFGGIAMAATLDLKLSAVILIMIPVFAVLLVWFIHRVIPAYRKQQEKIDQANAVLRDQISGVRVVKAFVKERFEQEKMDAVSKDLSSLNLYLGQTTSLMSPLFLFIVNLVVIVLMWFGGVRAEAGEVQIGTIIAMVTYANFILSAVMMSSIIFMLLPRAEVSAVRIQEILNTECSVREREDCIHPAEIRGNVKFDNVSFSYVPEDPGVAPVLRDIDFEARPGQVTAIIGSTGCGKTTLLNLIDRLMDATGGHVLMDGNDVKDLSVAELRNAIGMVPQKAFLFSGTLAENLRCAKPDATDEELWDALRIAQAEDFIREKPEGLNVRVSEGGTNFSGGQRQRLAIARAIVRRPSVYIFDDSFSALDYKTDRRLRQALKEITAESSVIIVAQRISTIADADQILVMNKGIIEDIGTHNQLISRCRTYQEIAASQPSEEGGDR